MQQPMIDHSRGPSPIRPSGSGICAVVGCLLSQLVLSEASCNRLLAGPAAPSAGWLSSS
jgi:hypothetical protein